jgi:phosphoribosyl 1,2-cyclic phosphodiesterase
MINQEIITVPTAGQRFTLAGTEYEISHSDHYSVRYTSVRGGLQILKELESFNSLTRNDSFKYTYDVNVFIPRSDKEQEQQKYRLDYVQTILSNTNHPYAEDFVKTIIAKIAEDRGEECNGQVLMK